MMFGKRSNTKADDKAKREAIARAIKTGKVPDKPRPAGIWFINGDTVTCPDNTVITRAEYDAGKSHLGNKPGLVSGGVVMFIHDEESLPIGTDPEQHPSMLQRAVRVITDAVADIFHHTQQPLSVQEKRKRVIENLEQRRQRQEKERRNKNEKKEVEHHPVVGYSGTSQEEIGDVWFEDKGQTTFTRNFKIG